MAYYNYAISILLLLCLQRNVSAQSPRVCVIGGGLAGLAAAGELERSGIEYVLVEATDRLGGRVNPLKLEDGSYIQLGAEYINGEENEMYRIAKRLGILGEKIDDFGIYQGNVSFGIGGSQFNNSDLIEWQEFIDPIEDDLTEDSTNEKLAEKSVGEVFQKKYEKFLESHMSKKNVFDGLAKLYISYYESEWSAPVHELSLANLDEFDDKSNDSDAWQLSGNGFQAILEDVKKHVPAEKIRLNSTVTRIDWHDLPISVQLSSGDTVECTYVILTVPLGHLKHNLDMFHPKLPKEKRDVIEYLGFGSLEKIFLDYEQPWWDSSAESIITVRIAGLMKKGDNLTDSIRTFQMVPGKPNMLMLWLSGKGPAVSTKLSDDEMGNIITEHLREAFNDSSIPQPKRVITHHWTNDPLTMGAYSYITPSSYRNLDDSYADMASPVESNDRLALCFAGEHTHQTLYQTTSGAFESGVREAQRIARYIKTTTNTHS